jgi:hypothetical protein
MTEMLTEGINCCFSGLFRPTPVLKLLLIELCNFFMETPVHTHSDLFRLICLKRVVSCSAIAGIELQQQEDIRDSPDDVTQIWGSSREGHWYPISFWFCSMLPAKWNYAVGYQVMLAIVKSYSP